MLDRSPSGDSDVGTREDPPAESANASAKTSVKASVDVSQVGDQPTIDDSLGFRPYVEALAAFLASNQTKPPLTLSVEGEWGCGKSSFMLQLSKELRARHGSRPYLSVHFNAWRHDKEDALWAAFALEFMRQVSAQRPPWPRLRGHLKLFATRVDWKGGWFDVVRIAALWLLFVLAGLVVLFGVIGPQQPGMVATWVGALRSEKDPWANVLVYLIQGGGLAAVVGGLASAGLKLKEIAGNPLEVHLRRYMASSDYRDRAPFVERFHRDFKNIVRAYADPHRVYVFIDDLDRCEVPKAADLMQALNLLIAEDPRLIFIVGMDREKVAAGLAAKYEKLLPYLAAREDMPRDGAPLARFGLDYGYTFIEKFIQIPFRVPEPEPDRLSHFLVSLAKGRAGEPEPDRMDSIELAFDGDSEIVHDVLRTLAPGFDNNPRRSKQFVNVFRLRAYIAYATGLFRPAPGEPQLTLEALGKFVAVTLVCPGLVVDLAEEPHALLELERIALGTATVSKVAAVTERWMAHPPLMRLLRCGVARSRTDDATRDRYSVADIDVLRLLKVSPAIVREGRQGSAEAQADRTIDDIHSGAMKGPPVSNRAPDSQQKAMA